MLSSFKKHAQEGHGITRPARMTGEIIYCLAARIRALCPRPLSLSKRALIGACSLALLSSCIHKKYETPIAKTTQQPDKILFDSVTVDRVLQDGDHIDLGGIRLTAHLTAGHTPGCTTWTTQLWDGRNQHSVVIACQISVPAANISYEGMDADFKQTYTLLRSLPCDIFLAEHGKAFSLTEKLARRTRNSSINPFVDPTGCARYVDQAEQEAR